MMHYNILCNGVKDFIPQCVDQEFCTADKFFQHGIVIIRNGGIIRPVPAFCPADINCIFILISPRKAHPFFAQRLAVSEAKREKRGGAPMGDLAAFPVLAAISCGTL